MKRLRQQAGRQRRRADFGAESHTWTRRDEIAFLDERERWLVQLSASLVLASAVLLDATEDTSLDGFFRVVLLLSGLAAISAMGSVVERRPSVGTKLEDLDLKVRRRWLNVSLGWLTMILVATAVFYGVR